eukprot:gnl/MRDRNA2_/MRDRNA2_97223_c0_seq1.p1 gnl/MRDRNA2_/MRDRNA2_97223_c0~~gnl/MRDRNA2_/MRDRNA2_97223_c0_seq1.p1  ORF type:complete len:574 (+),score=114.62 gnl/MRDRNA2_/MRDRNA2_97223_c0_seq1:88-1722(+)
MSEPDQKEWVSLEELAVAIDSCVYTKEQYLCIVDTYGQASTYLKYRGKVVDVRNPVDTQPENLQDALLSCLESGTCLCIDLGSEADCKIQALFSPGFFPEEVLNPRLICLQSTLDTLSKREVQPKEGFRFVITCLTAPPFLKDRMTIVSMTAPRSSSSNKLLALHAGEQVAHGRSEKLMRIDADLIDAGLDGNIEATEAALSQGASALAVDSSGISALSWAACKGHSHVVDRLLSLVPLGCNPNAQGTNGRTALHSAAFHGFVEIVRNLLDAGADPRIKDMYGQTAASIAEDADCIDELNAWIENPQRTIDLLERRRHAIAIEQDKLATTQEKRRQLERDRKIERLVKAATHGELDLLRFEIGSLSSPALVSAYRDSRGNSVLHLTAWHGHEEATAWLIEECSIPVDLRDAKGWTPLMIAAFHGQRSICTYLLKKGADVEACNDYNFSVRSLAQDDEIRALLHLETGTENREEESIGKDNEANDAYKEFMAMSVGDSSECKGEAGLGEVKPSGTKTAPKSKAKSRSKSRGKQMAKAVIAKPRHW